MKTILAFYSVDNEFGWDRDTFDMDDAEAFRIIWSKRDSEDIRIYDIDSKSFSSPLASGFEFETDYNDELFDGGWWCKVMHVCSIDIKD